MADDTQRLGIKRRDFFRMAGYSALAFWLLSLRDHDTHPSPPSLLPDINFVVPKPMAPVEEAKYREEYRKLDEAIILVAAELTDFTKQFAINDILTLLAGFKVTLVPRLNNQQEGVCRYEMNNIRDERTGDLKAVNQLLRACINIKLLDEAYGTNHCEHLDYGMIGTKLTNAYLKLNPNSPFKPEDIKRECTHIFNNLVEACTAFERPEPKDGTQPPPDKSSQRILNLTLADSVPLNVTIKNPTLEASQEEAAALRTAPPPRSRQR